MWEIRMPNHRSRPSNRLTSLLLVSFFVFALFIQSIEPVFAAGGEWTLTGSMNIARDSHTATLLQNGKVLVVGGRTDLSTYLSSAELYDPSTGTWLNTGSLITRRSNHTATLLSNGKVLVTGGGNNSSGSLSSAELYNPTTGTWTATGSLNHIHNSHTATILPNGKVLVAGGEDFGDPTSNIAELYDPDTEIWTETGSMNVARRFHTATLLPNGRVLVAGGDDDPIFLYTSAELYDPSTGIWTATGSLNNTHYNHTATLLDNGKVLVAGGYGSYIGTELYNPATGIWTTTGSMNARREGHTAALLPDGKVLVTGGEGSVGDSADLYNPATSIWTAIGSMNDYRFFYHTDTLLTNGKVLIAGGYSVDNKILASAELYDPTFSILYLTVNQAIGQSDPTNSSPINFTTIFSETVTGFDSSDVAFTGSTISGTLSASVTGTGPIYNISVTGMTGTGKVVVSIPTGVALDSTGKANSASTSTDNSVTYDVTAPIVTLNQAIGQSDPANNDPINFTAIFSKAINKSVFVASDITLGGTVTGILSAVITEIAPNNSTTFNIAVSGMTGDGTVNASIQADRVTDLSGNGNTASTSLDNSVTYYQNVNISPAVLKTVTDGLGNTWTQDTNGWSCEPSSSCWNPNLQIGDVVTFTATASDPKGLPLEYRFTLPNRVNYIVQDWSSTNTFIWNVTLEDVGPDSRIGIYVRNSDGQDWKGAWAGDDYTFVSYTVNDPNTSPSELTGITDGLGNTWTQDTNGWSCEPSSSCWNPNLQIGDVVTFTATATDPKGLPLEYRFTLPNRVNYIVQDWSSTNTFIWNVTLEDVGPDSRIGIYVRNSDGQDWKGAWAGDDYTFVSYTTYVNKPPSIVSSSLKTEYIGNSPSSFNIQFSEGVYDPEGNDEPDDVTNLANYLLVGYGSNKTLDTISCLSGVSPNDDQVTIASVTYNDISFTATIYLVNPLPIGSYRLFACGSTSIVDLDGNKINNGRDYTFDFLVDSTHTALSPSPTVLPETGFAYGQETRLPHQPAASTYNSTELILKIQALGISIPIVGVPQNSNGWDVTWLGKRAGYLEGSAFPTWAGNTVITGHVWSAENTPGIFADLKSLRYGDQFQIDAFGKVYTYEVRENSQVSPKNIKKVFQHEDYDWVTLLTCEDYNLKSSGYNYRRMVRAVLVSVK
jgi:LPXTG-site transpeptidase (sortase) family protein